MREWRLTKSKEYKLFTTIKSGDSTGERGTFFEPTLPSTPFVKAKLIKANLSCLDFNAFLGKGDFDYPMVPSRSGVAYISGMIPIWNKVERFFFHLMSKTAKAI